VLRLLTPRAVASAVLSLLITTVAIPLIVGGHHDGGKSTPRVQKEFTERQSAHTPVPSSLTQIALRTKDLVYDSQTQRIYASIPSNAGSRGNTITIIDPATGALGDSIAIGSEPGKMIISDNHQNLYVSLDGAAAVRRLDLSSNAPGLQFGLGSLSPNEPFYVEDMATVPGRPQSIAVSRKLLGNSPRHAGVAIYDDGVARPTVSAPHPQEGSNVIEFSGTSTRLYGYCNETTERGFRKMVVNDSGVSVESVTEQILGFAKDFRFDNGLIYSSTGIVINPESLRRVGLFYGVDPLFVTYSLVLPDSAANRVYFLAGGANDPFVIRAFDASTFVETASLTLTGLGIPGTSSPTSFIRWGTDGLAFAITDRVFILHTSDLIPVSTATLTPVTVAPGIVELPLVTNNLIYDQNTDRVYVTVPGYAGSIGNTLVAINPQTAVPESPIWVGSEPAVMARSPDGQYLYISLDGGGSVRRFDLPSRTLQPEFSLGVGLNGSRFAFDMGVLSTNPNVLAVAMVNAAVIPRYEGVAAFDNGTQLPAVTQRFTTVLELEAPLAGSTMYGYDSGSSQFSYQKLTVTPSGVTVAATMTTAITGFDTAIKYDNGRLYSSKGTSIDAETGATIGQFPLSGSAGFYNYTPLERYLRPFVPDSSVGRVFFLAGNNNSTTLQVYDMNSFGLVGSLNIPGVVGSPGELIRWGADGLAFNTSSGQLFFVRTALIPPASPTPTPTPTVTPTPTPQTQMQLVLEASPPVIGQAIALDSVSSIRDPFWVNNPNNAFAKPSDPNTRVSVFVTDLHLDPGEPPSSVVVVLGDSSNQTYSIGAEAVIPLAGNAMTQVTFRLPSGLVVGTCVFQVKAHGQVTNSGTFRIRNQ